MTAGKTSLMAALASRASYGTISGVVLVNGQRTSLERYRKVGCLVCTQSCAHLDLLTLSLPPSLTLTLSLVVCETGLLDLLQLPQAVTCNMHLRR